MQKVIPTVVRNGMFYTSCTAVEEALPNSILGSCTFVSAMF